MTFVTGSDYVGCEYETIIIVDNYNNINFTTHNQYTCFIVQYSWEVTIHMKSLHMHVFPSLKKN